MKVSLVLISLLVITSACTKLTKVPQDIGPNPGKQFKIANGSPISHLSFPAVGALFVITGDEGYGYVSCTGTLLNATTVLTAAHCVKDSQSGQRYPKDEMFFSNHFDDTPVFVFEDGFAIFDPAPEERRAIESILVHPDYIAQASAPTTNDVALLTLKKPIVLNRYPQVRPVPVQLRVGEMLIGIGFGLDDDAGSGVKRSGEYRYEGSTQWTPEGVFEISPGPSSQISCSGDSGSPALKRLNSKYYIVGVSHAGPSGICRERGYAYYTDIISVSSWVRSSLGEEPPPPTPNSPWRNPANHLDVNGDGAVSPLDALLVINAFEEIGMGELSGVGKPVPPKCPYVDVSNDRILAPLDALLVINELGYQTDEADSGSSSDTSPDFLVADIMSFWQGDSSGVDAALDRFLVYFNNEYRPLRMRRVFENLLGMGEKWIYSRSERRWMLILPKGQVILWKGQRVDGKPTGAVIANLLPKYHADPSLLFR